MKDARGHGSDSYGAHIASIAAQHGIHGPAIPSTGPRFEREAIRSVVGSGRGNAFATSGGARAANDLRLRRALGGVS